MGTSFTGCSQPSRRIARSIFSSPFEIERVPALHLDRGDALIAQPPEPGEGERDERLLRGVAGRAHGGHDPAARLRDLEVRRAPAAELELVGALAREHQVGVRVDEARADEAAVRAQDLGVHPDRRGGERALGPEERDLPVEHADRAAGDRREGLFRRSGRRPGDLEHRRGVDDDEVERHLRS